MSMDELRKRIKRAVDAKLVEYKELSEAIGKNHAYVQQFVTRGSPQELLERHVATITKILEQREGGRGRLVDSFDPDAPPEEAVDDSDPVTVPVTGSGDVANLNIRGGLGLGSPEGVEVSEGGQIYADHVSGFWSFPPAVKAGWRNMPQVYSLPVEGDSMEPTLTSGSYVFVDMTHNVPSPEDIYACDYGDGLTIKRLQMVPRTDKIMVMSDNPRYSNYELRREDVRVYGRVVAWFQWRG
jgi:hypothetical protein